MVVVQVDGSRVASNISSSSLFVGVHTQSLFPASEFYNDTTIISSKFE